MSRFLQVALEEARQGKAEGGIPIGSVLVYRDEIIGGGHNRRLQCGSAILHAEMDAQENAGRRSAAVYRESTSAIGFKNDVWNPVGPFIRPFSSLSIRNECAVAL